MAVKTSTWNLNKISPFILPRDGIWFESRKPFSPPVNGVKQLVVTIDEVILRSWEPRSESFRPANNVKPRELLVPMAEFQKNVQIKNDIGDFFGQDVVQHITGLINGHIDYLARLPEQILVTLISRLRVRDIIHLSEVNKYLHKVCHSNAAWRNEFQHSFGELVTNSDIVTLSNTVGWYRLYIAADHLCSSGESLHLQVPNTKHKLYCR